MNDEITNVFSGEIKKLMTQTSEKIEIYLKSIKEASVNEIMNGSISKAQEILDTIIPLQNAAENLVNSQNEFLNSLKLENFCQSNPSEKIELRILNTSKNISSKTSGGEKLFHASILKALIYLGGSADIKSITEFVKRESFKAGIVHEKEKQFFENEEKLLKIVLEENYRMLKDGLVIEDNLSKKWEILPSGIDFLSKYDISLKAKAN